MNNRFVAFLYKEIAEFDLDRGRCYREFLINKIGPPHLTYLNEAKIR